MRSGQDPSDENNPDAAPAADAGAMPRESSAEFSISLTLTEKRVLHLASQSKTKREISESLGISYATVKRPVENILRKLNLRNRVEAGLFALSVQRCANENGAACPLEGWWRRIRENY